MATDFAPTHVLLNDRVLPVAEAAISPFDRGLLFGDGVFETMRTYGGRVFRFEQHLQRLARSMTALELNAAVPADPLRRLIDELLAAEGLAEGRLRLTVTGGAFDGQIRLKRSGPPTIFAFATPLVSPKTDDYRQGIDLVISGFRQPWASPLARIKTIHRLEYLMAREEALRQGATDALILDDRGGLCEGTSSNLFLIERGTLVTPSLDSPILPGVTRDAVIESARSIGVPVEERFIPLDELWTAAEVFVTATSWEVLPVRTVNGKVVGPGARGALTEKIHAAFRALVGAEMAATPPSR